MEISYWKARWRNNRTGWHMSTVYPPLKKYWPTLELGSNATVLVPLCGKSLDLAWLVEQGYRVTGVEVSEKAVIEFFNKHDIEYHITPRGPFTVYHGKDVSISLWVGDFLAVRSDLLPSVEAVYDKASLIALPEQQRKQYAEKILDIYSSSNGFQMLLNTFEYPESEMGGPPFPVFREEIERLYGHQFRIELLQEESILEEMSKFRARGLSSYLVEKVNRLF